MSDLENIESENEGVKEEFNFVDIFYETILTLKDHWSSFATVFLVKSFIFTFVFFFSSTTDDATKISVALAEIVASLFVYVIYANLFYSKLNGTEFSIRKCLWDLPTLIYYELSLGIFVLLGCLALLLPGLFVIYVFCFVPLISILFDYDEEKNSFSITHSYIKKEPLLYFVIFAINGAMAVVSTSSESIISYFPHNIVLYIVVALVLTFFSFVSNALVVAFFNAVSKEEREHFLSQN